MRNSSERYSETRGEGNRGSGAGEALLEPLPELVGLEEGMPMCVGAHLSIAGNICDSIDRAIGSGCDCLQIFSRSPRSWRAKSLSAVDAEEFRRRRQAAGLSPVVVHIPYLINLCTSDAALYARSTAEFASDLDRAAAIGADYFVSHVGSHTGAGEKSGLRQIAKALRGVLAGHKSPVMILLENTSGAANSLGHTFRQLQAIISAARSTGRLGICLDTAHAFAAGYDLASREGLEKTLEEIDRWVGIEHLKLIHANDSKTPLGSRSDRHEHIGKGHIGLRGFRRIVNHPLLRDLPFILETPHDRLGGYELDLPVIRSLRTSA